MGGRPLSRWGVSNNKRNIELELLGIEPRYVELERKKDREYDKKKRAK